MVRRKRLRIRCQGPAWRQNACDDDDDDDDDDGEDDDDDLVM